ncbi:MAG: AMP-binding protein, partial [Chloroflexi bacterium]|nr:AMP-binding protein [Chloroflexota bacterium]
ARPPIRRTQGSSFSITYCARRCSSTGSGGSWRTSNLLPYLLAMPSWLGNMREGEVAFTVAPFHFSAGIFYTLLTVIAGTTLVLVKEFEPAETLKLIGERRINHAFLPPAVLLRILQTVGAGLAPAPLLQADLTSLKSIVYGGSAILTDVLRRAIAYFGCEFTQMYGLTETTAALTCLSWADHDLDGPNSHRLKSCGQPLYGTDIRAVDRNGRECPTGEMGEIVVRTPMMMKGYWKKPEATAEVIRDGWLHTGDGGIIDADGFIYIQDRIKDMIVSGGANIYSAEVENCLIGHPAVADVAVIGVPDETWGEAVKAMVVLKPGAKAEADELIEFCKGRIANYKRPRSVEFIASIPRNANGKVLKRELRRPYWEGRERKVV